ncbi:hypothetical protein [Paenibacillus hamazuiensis]|uniref:hypothetical protein n=1 Tax=Paenibacillus hamazuiensis TaxID=2936508 RepID=UPI00200E692B|nr:hypothetical protein [Paenibacillus hamazuiensis]
MELTFQELTINYDSDDVSLNAFIQDVERLLSERNLVLTGMRVDGFEIYEDYEQYLEEKIYAVNKIEVIVDTKEKVRHDIIVTAQRYLIRANPALKQMANEFYKKPTQETWVSFDQWSEGYGWISQMVELISTQNSTLDMTSCKQILTEIHPYLLELEEAIRHEDFTLLGDLFMYEIGPRYEVLQSEISKMIDQEVIRDDLN